MSRDLFNLSAEQSVLGGLMVDNNAFDRVLSLQTEHFFRADHRAIFAETRKQILAGKRVDAVTLAEALGDKVVDCLPYLASLHSATASAANIARHADIVLDHAMLRALSAFGLEAHEQANNAAEPADVVLGRLAQQLDALGQVGDSAGPQHIAASLEDYQQLLTARMDGLVRPISTGFKALDRQLDGGLERGTLTVLAGRPAMGKTALGLALARNVGAAGTALFLSMEMSRHQVSDRNIAALGGVSVSWLRQPTSTDAVSWGKVTEAFKRSQELSMYVDDRTSMSMLEIRAKARQIKRKHGLDLLVIDQLSFIKGGSNENKAYDIGEHTRGCVELAKELDCAVLLLAQLNRDCEKRQNRRPIMADLAMSGSIEQDAANVLFVYRDVIYNPATFDRDVCEVITGKQRQGAIGTAMLRYIGYMTKFEDLDEDWMPHATTTAAPPRGFD